MSYALDHYIVADAPADARAAFIRRTYAHLAGAILAFAGLATLFLTMPIVDRIVPTMVTGYNWLFVLGAYMGVSWVAQRWAHSPTSLSTQYAGLLTYIVAVAVIFLPLMYVADRRFPGTIQSAGLMTLMMFGGLTAAVFVTKKDFSFLGPILCVAGFLALGLIVASIIFGFSLGLAFAFAMVAVASAAILYDTSNVLHHYRTDQHVAASLALFASVALLFYYILWIVMSERD